MCRYPEDPPRNNRANPLRLLAAAVVSLSLLGCGGSNSTGTSNPAAPTAAATIQSLNISGTTTFQGDLGTTSQLTAIASFSDNSTENVTDSTIWQTSNSAVATVSGTGLVTTVGYGQTEVTAQYQGLTARADVNVSAPAPTNSRPVTGTLTVSHDATGLPIASLTEFLFTLPDATDSDGDPLTFAWDFGDGSTAASRSAVHTYAGGGTFVVTVTISDTQGLTASTTLALTVESVDGRWTNVDPGGTRRTFALVQSNTSTSLTGTYIRNNVDTGSLYGTLTAPNWITISAGTPGDQRITITRAELDANIQSFTGTIFRYSVKGQTLTWVRE